jgi:hypothetical protein
MSGFNKVVNGSIMGLTDLDRKIIYVRGWIILHPSVWLGTPGPICIS